MSITLDWLVAELESDVPASDGVPSAAQYENAIKDAVRSFSERCGLEQISTLNIVAGTATYDLPADFLALILLESLLMPDGILHSSGGLIPITSTWEERWTIRNGQITFYPTPTYTVARDISYKAGWVLTAVDQEYGEYEYAAMGEREAQIVLLKAKSFALTKQANVSSGMKYSLGAVSVDNSGTAGGLIATAESAEKEFEDACRKYNGTVMNAG